MTWGPHEGLAVDRRMALAREWDALVDEVRQLPGFEDFLRPPRLQSLLPAAAKGPVVIVNVSRWRCDALIVTVDGVISLELPDLTLAEATDRANRYLSILQAVEVADREHAAATDAAARDPGRISARRLQRAATALSTAMEAVDVMLTSLQAWLWDTVADPVLHRLGLTDTPSGDTLTWPRIWWCPTGPLTVLPLHSAGYHAEPEGDGPARTVLDRVVSSYTPTLRALLEARAASTDTGPDRLLLVTVDAPGQVPLHTAAERSELLEHLADDRVTVLEGSQATREAVRRELPRHRWVHFSCHGDQDLTDPSRGGLLLHDATLTISDITADRFHGDFAGLSACKTAVGGVDLLDEAITLAAALHYTGYRHVVAALWSVQDQASADVFAAIYRGIVIDGSIAPDRAPAALHDAVRDLRARENGRHWPHLWTPFTHTGP